MVNKPDSLWIESPTADSKFAIALVCDIAVSYNAPMATYRVVEFRRDGLAGWTVESDAPNAKRKPRLLYTTSERAQAEADRLTAIEAAADVPAATAKLAS